MGDAARRSLLRSLRRPPRADARNSDRVAVVGRRVKIVALSGSLRGSSSNSTLLRHVRQAAEPAHDVVVYSSLDEIPHFSPDRDRDPLPVAVEELRACLRDADAVLIATPEYAGGMPGSLKNGLDWLVGSGDLYGKRAVVVSAAPGADRGANARESLERTLRVQGAHVCDSFTVAVSRDLSDAAFATMATEVLTRAIEAVTTGPCAATDTR